MRLSPSSGNSVWMMIAREPPTILMVLTTYYVRSHSLLMFELR